MTSVMQRLSSSEEGMDAFLLSPFSLSEPDGDATQPNGKGEEPALPCYFVTPEAFAILEEDDAIAEIVSEELQETLSTFRPVLDVERDDLFELAGCSAVMVTCVLIRTRLPMCDREYSIQDGSLGREGPSSRGWAVQETDLCASYYRDALSAGTPPHTRSRATREQRRSFNEWLTYHCFDVIGSRWDPEMPLLHWEALTLPQRALLCAWTNIWTLYLLASVTADDKPITWLNDMLDGLEKRANDPLTWTEEV